MAVYDSNKGFVNPRLEGRSAVQSLKDVMRSQNLVNSTQLDNPLRKDYWAGDVAKANQPELGGWKGFLTDVIESPIGKVVVKAGEVISMPGRAVVASIEEIRDALDGDPNTVASWNDFTKNVADPIYGFGSLTGDVFEGDSGWAKWGNRLIGLAGDIITDPLTYVTFGANKALGAVGKIDDVVEAGTKGVRVTGRAGREALATRVLDKTGNAELAKQVARYGRSAMSTLSDDVFQQVGLERAGVYFMGKRIKGTTRVGQSAEKGLTSMRVWSGDHFFKRANEFFTLDDVKEARKALARGTAPSERVETYLRMVASENTRRAAKAAEARYAQASLRQLVGDVGEQSYRSATPNLYKALEGAVALDTLGATDRVVYDRVVSWFDDLWGRVDGAARAVDPNATTRKVSQYFPHVLTDDAMRFVTSSQSDFARGLREVIYNPLDPAGAFKPRMMADDLFFGVKLGVDDLKIERLNEIARNAGYKGDFFETNLAAVMDKYVGSYAEQMGMVARKKYLVDKGVFQKLERVDKVDKDAVKALRRSMNEMAANRSNAAKVVQKSVDDIRKVIDEVTGGRLKNAEGRLDAWAKGTAAADEAVELAGRAVVRTREHLDEMSRVMNETSMAISNMFDDEVPDLVRGLEEQHQRALRSIEHMRSNLTDIMSSAEQTTARLKQIEDEITALRETEEIMFQFGNSLQMHIDDVIDGKNIPDSAVGAEMLRDVKKSARGDVRIAGGRDKVLADYVASPKFKAINGQAEISMKKLREFTPETVLDVVRTAARGEAEIDDIRAAIVWMDAVSDGALSRSSRTEQALRRMFEMDGVTDNGSLRRMGELSQWKKLLAEARQNKEFVRVERVVNNYQKVYDDVTAAVMTYYSSNKMLNEIMGVNRFERQGLPTVTEAMARKAYDENPRAFVGTFLAKTEFDSLQTHFANYLDDTFEGQLDSFDDFVKSLTTLAESKVGFQQQVDFTAQKFGQEATKVGSVSFNAMRFIDDIDEIVASGDADDITSFVELMLSGRTPASLDTTITPGPARTNEEVASLGRAASGLAEPGPKAKGRGGRATTGGRAVEPSERVAGGVKNLKERLRVEQAKAAGGLTPQPEAELRKVIIKFYLKELQEQEVAQASLLGRIQSESSRLRKINPKIRVDGVSPTWASEIGDKAKSDIIDAWFAFETERRMKAITDTLIPVGLVPDEVIGQRIYQKVAQEFVGDTRREISSLYDVSDGLDKIYRAALEGQHADAASLHDEITRFLRANNGNVHLSKHAGSASSYEIRRSFDLYGGRTGARGELERVRKLEIELRKATTVSEKQEIVASLAGRSYKEMSAKRARLLKEEWIPWYRSVTGRSKGRVTYAEIQNALNVYAPKASEKAEKRAVLKAVRSGQDQIRTQAVERGRAYGSIAEDASREEMISWLASVSAIMGNQARATRRQFRGMLAMADPFSTPSMASQGVRAVRGDAMPTFIADVARRTYNDLLLERDRIASLSIERRKLVGEVAVAEKKAKRAGAARRTVEDVEGVGGPVRPYVGQSEPYREFSSDDLKLAREAYKQISELSNDPNYLSGVERQQLNEVIKLLAQLDPSDTFVLKSKSRDVSIARQTFNRGTDVYVAKGDGTYVKLASLKELDKFAKDASRAENATFYTRSPIGTRSAQKRTASGKDSPEWISAQRRHQKAIEKADSLEAKFTTDPKKAAANKAQADKIRDEADKELLNFGAPRESSIDEFKPITGWSSSVDEQVKQLDKEIARLEKDYSLSINPAEKGRMVSSDTYDLQVSQSGDVSEAIRKKIDGLSRRKSYLLAGVPNDVAIGPKFDPKEIEALFMPIVQGQVVPDVSVLSSPGRLTKEMRPLWQAQQEVQQQLSRVGKEIRAVEQKSIRLDDAFRRRKISRAEYDVQRNLNESIAEELRRDMVSLRREYAKAQMRIDAADPIVRNSALQKAHRLSTLISMGEITMGDIAESIAAVSGKATDDTVRARLKFLDDAWKGSDERLAVERMAKLNASVGARIQRAIVADENKMNRLLDRTQIALSDKGDAVSRRLVAKGQATEEAVAGLGAVDKFGMAIDVSRGVAAATKKNFDDLLDLVTKQTGGQYDAKVRFRELMANKKNAGKSPVEIVAMMRAELEKVVPRLPKKNLLKGEFGGVAKIADYDSLLGKMGDLLDEADFIARNYMMANGRSIFSDQQDYLMARIGAMEAEAAAWEKATKTVKARVAKDEQARGKAMLKEGEKAEANVAKAQKAYDEAIDTFEAATIAYGDAQYSENAQRLEKYVADLSDYAKRVEEQFPAGKVKDPKDLPFVLALLDELEEVIGRNGPELAKTNPEMMPVLEKLRNDFLINQVNFFMADKHDELYRSFQKFIDDGTFGRTVEEKVSKGFKSLASIGLPSYQAQKWLSEMSVNLNRLSKPEFVRGLTPFLTKYTSFFKAYAVSSPGFVVRNTMGNTFMLFAAGADVKSMTQGLELYNLWRRAAAEGKEAAWIASLPASRRNLVETAVAAMDASGYGRGMEAVQAFNPKRKWLVNNRWVNTFRKANEVSEGSARFILAWDSVRKGADFDAATARVKRYLFDYEATSAGDEVMRSIIPFWFWMSRNLPMQIVNQYENPRAYLIYQKAMKSVAQDDEDEMVPSWLKEQGGIKVGANTYLAPDLGFNRISQQFNELKDPKRLLSYVNPALRVPVELLGERRFYNDVPFSERGEQPMGGPASGAVAALASILGQEKRTREGEMGVDPKLNYALMNLLPPLAQTERLLPATDLYKGKQGGSILSYFGVPLKTVTPEMRRAEQRRRQIEQEALRKKAAGE